MAFAVPRFIVEPASATATKRFAIATALTLVVLFGIEAIALGEPILPVDDAYITLHNAVVLREGRDTNYVGVPGLVGATSGVHVALTALLTLVLKPTWALWTACRLGVVVYALGLLRLAQSQAASWPLALLVMLAGMTVGYSPNQLFNGLETSMAMGAVAWTLALASEPRPYERRSLLILLGVLPFVRPELAALSGLIFVLLGVEAWKTGVTTRTRTLATMASFAIVGALPWTILYWATTGAPFPNTVQAKKFFFADGCAPALFKGDVMITQLRQFAETLGYVSRAVFLLALTRLGWAGLLFAGALIGAYYINLPGALAHYEQRYLYILVPLLIYAACSVTRHRSIVLRIVGVALPVVAVDESAWRLPSRWNYHFATKEFTKHELMSVATWANQNLPAESRLLVHDAGYIAWGTDFQLQDMVGLKTPKSMPYHRDLTWKTCVESGQAHDSPQVMGERVGASRGKAISEIGKAGKATHLVVLRGWNNVFGITNSLTHNGWKLDHLRDAPMGYDVYALAAPP